MKKRDTYLQSRILYSQSSINNHIILLQHKTNKEDEKAFYGGSRFEMICNHENEDDPKTSNGYFCKVLCGLCEKGNECCIAKHLGCDVSGWAINQSSFLRGEGKEAYVDVTRRTGCATGHWLCDYKTKISS